MGRVDSPHRAGLTLASRPARCYDPGATREVEEIVERIRAAGAKVIMTTHNLGQARRLADEILFIDRGRLVERTPVDQFFRSPQTAAAAAFIKGELPWH